MKKDFGSIQSGEKASLYVLKNKNGMEAAVSDYGASWVYALVPDRDGVKRDVLLGYDDAAGYEAGGEAVGAIVGRVVNRIAGAAFKLNGRVYHMEKNKGDYNLHSGPDYYHKRLWQTLEEDDSHVVFALESPEGDQGFPGTLNVQVTYALDDENVLSIAYHAQSDADTLFNMSNHAYFNLNGHDSGDILTHQVWIDADRFTESDADSITTGKILPVDGTPLDFRVKKAVGKEIEVDFDQLILGNGYDQNLCVNGQGYRKAAEITAEESGITMEVYTDRPGLQIYSGNYLHDEKGKNGAVYQKRNGICFETQVYPDAIHHENFPTDVIRKGEALDTKTAYKFLIK